MFQHGAALADALSRRCASKTICRSTSIVLSTRERSCATMKHRRDIIVKICVLASSSSGNSAFIRTERTRILVDAGLSKRDLLARLDAIEEQCETLDAILITHEHSDHVSGLVTIARHFQAPI